MSAKNWRIAWWCFGKEKRIGITDTCSCLLCAKQWDTISTTKSPAITDWLRTQSWQVVIVRRDEAHD